MNTIEGDWQALDTISGRKTDTAFIDELRRTCESTNINFLLGAGCSYPAFGTLGNVETLLEELKSADTRLQINHAYGNNAELIEDFIEASLKASFFENAILPNETYFRDPSEPTKGNYERFCRAAMKLVAKREASTLPKQVTFFVTNYDICMDVALDQARVPTNSGYIGRFNPMVDLSDFGRRITASTLALAYQSEIASANLVKIHGCASWKNEKGAIEYSDKFELIEEIKKKILGLNLPIKIGATTQSQAETNKAEPLPKVSDELGEMLQIACTHANGSNRNDVRELLTAFNKLQIVWPTKHKFHDTVLDEIYYAQLRRLTNQLEVHNSVLLVAGFSFADEHIRKLILRAADTNPTLKVLILCYNKEAESQIRATFTKECKSELEKRPNRNIVTVTALKKEEGNEANLDLKTIASLLEKVTR